MRNVPDLQVKTQQKSVTQSKKNYEFIWRGVFLFISIVSSILINKIYIYQTSPYFDDIREGSFPELVLNGIPFGIFFIVCQTLVHKYFDQKCQQYFINHNKYKTEQARKKRSYTLVKWAFSLIYYAVSSLSAYLIIKDTSFMPTWLGGEGYCTQLTRYVNRLDQANLSMKIFYIIQFGKHLGRFFQHVFIRSEGNFYEYALHHGLSTFLIFFSYLMNMWLIGIFVLMIHDISDIVLILSRAYRDYRKYNKKILTILDVSGGFVWVSFRIFLLSYCCVYSSAYSVYLLWTKPQMFEKQVYDVMYFPGHFMAFMLLALQIMQIFWTYYIACSVIAVNISQKIAKHTYD